MAEEFTHRCRTDTPYYTTGPQQGRPPDGTFTRGTHVALLGPKIGGYPQVRSATGVTAYVDEADLEMV
ncbi:hypothetical protein [Sinorhizobium meliloti]|uniref:hypothetical protein n=1 Tax=Rhizobium meliloti TaxID=382 RepID=UPI000FDAB5C4|nr:hypothetical protein [Sinorhizobium meliloti]MCO6425097.1 hypothetical protein [Sinorhizobium meliloti]RVL38720.1 hypothetical protein CN148_09385 [Sinorhizobium meliloti]